MPDKDSRRNVVMIICDELRPDFLHAYGADFIPTPNICNRTTNFEVARAILQRR